MSDVSQSFGDLNGPIHRTMLIDAVVGRGLRSYDEINHYCRVGLAWYVGGMADQAGWNRHELEKLPSELLLQIYLNDKK